MVSEKVDDGAAQMSRRHVPQLADIGKPQREIEIRPVEEPVPDVLPIEEPAPAPDVPVKDPEQVPA